MSVKVIITPETIHEHNKAFSPYVPGLQVCWDSTSVTMLKGCPRKYYYTMVRGFRPKGESVHLRFGILLHSALEQYDKAIALGQSVPEAKLTAIRYALEQSGSRNEAGAFVPWDSGDAKKNRFTLVRSVVWYLEQYGALDAVETTILKNGKPAVELSFKLETDLVAPDGQHYLMSGHFDRIGKLMGLPYIHDRKTTGMQLNTNYFDGYSPDNQMTFYSFAGRIVLGEPVKGVIIDAMQIATNFTRFMRGFAHRTQSQLDEWYKEFKDLLRRNEQWVEEQHWPMNETACDKYGGCPFRKICSKSPEVREAFLLEDFKIEVWDPTTPRE